MLLLSKRLDRLLDCKKIRSGGPSRLAVITMNRWCSSAWNCLPQGRTKAAILLFSAMELHIIYAAIIFNFLRIFFICSTNQKRLVFFAILFSPFQYAFSTFLTLQVSNQILYFYWDLPITARLVLWQWRYCRITITWTFWLHKLSG